MRSVFRCRGEAAAGPAFAAGLMFAAGSAVGSEEVPSQPAVQESAPAQSDAKQGDRGKSEETGKSQGDTRSDEGVAKLSDMSVTEDALKAIANTPSASSFGFTKPLLETPRAVSFVSEEQISLMGISTVEDLMKAVPGVYTTTRYG